MMKPGAMTHIVQVTESVYIEHVGETGGQGRGIGGKKRTCAMDHAVYFVTLVLEGTG